MKKIALYSSILILAFGGGMLLENIFTQLTPQSNIQKVNKTSHSSTEQSVEKNKSVKSKPTTQGTSQKKVTKSKKQATNTKNKQQINTVNQAKKIKKADDLIAKANEVKPASQVELRALQQVKLQSNQLTSQTKPLLFRDLTPTVVHKQSVNHLMLTQSATIYQNPSTQAKKVQAMNKYRGFMATSTQSVKNEMGIWYQVAFPDEPIGWVQAKDTQNHNQDYYFYATGGPQPNLSVVQGLSIDVSIAKKRVYVKSGNQVIYTMLCQTARDGYETPSGHYAVNDYRASSFWSTFGGADYAVGWKDGGLYLFHSVEKETASGPYSQSQGLKLGVTPKGVSHGCVQLAIEDAKWFYNQLPIGTPVNVY